MKIRPLKPCPFCACALIQITAYRQHSDLHQTPFAALAQCSSCLVGMHASSITASEATAQVRMMWNRRAP